MLKTDFKIALRNLSRNKTFSFINIFGLALGLTIFLLIFEYVVFEWSANRFNKNFDHLYRVHVQYKDGHTDYGLPPGFAPIIKNQFPGVESYARVAGTIGGGVLTFAGENASPKVFREDAISYVDGSFLSIFSFPLLSGTRSLYEPKTLALSEAMSQKLFGTTDAAGKTITLSNQFGNALYTVKAVYRLPENSDIKAQVLLSFQTLASAANRDGNDWADPATLDNGFTTMYLQVKKDTKAPTLAGGITSYLRSTNPGSKTDVVYLQPFREMHLHRLSTIHITLMATCCW